MANKDPMDEKGMREMVEEYDTEMES